MRPGLFGCLTKLGGKRAELVQKFVPRSRGGIFRNQSTHVLGSNGVNRVLFWCVLYHLRAFGTVWLLTKLGAILAELVQKFVPRSRIVILLPQTHPIHPIGP